MTLVMDKIKWPYKDGERFQYLGLTMIVCGFQQRPTSPVTTEEMLLANYVDKNGRLRTIGFNPDGIPALLAERGIC